MSESFCYCIGCGYHEPFDNSMLPDGRFLRIDTRLGVGVCSDCHSFLDSFDNGRRSFSVQAEINLLR